jgi:DNA repair exonuclease SbcCD ATPase subunit
LKILKLEATNIKKLKVVQITPQGNVVQITGANSSGKSSVLDSIYYALAGTSHHPSKPVRQGQDKAVIKLDLGEVLVTRKFDKEGGTSLVVEASNGARFPSPQRMLDDLLGVMTFDPLAFTRLHPREQLETLRRVVKLDIDLDKLDGQNQADFDNRAKVHRDVKQLEGELAGVPVVPEGTPEEELSLGQLARELQEAGERNSLLDHNLAAHGRDLKLVEAQREQAKKEREQAGELMRQANELIKAAELKEEWANKHETELQAKVFPAREDTTTLSQKISAAEETNRHVRNKQRRLSLMKKLDHLRNTASNLTGQMKQRLDEKTAAMSRAAMPVPGLSFGEGEVLYNGLPLAQASSAEQLRVSVGLAMALNPKLRVLRVQDGSLLDEQNMELLEELAQLQEFQIWVETVDQKGKRPCVVMEDGEVKQ